MITIQWEYIPLILIGLCLLAYLIEPRLNGNVCLVSIITSLVMTLSISFYVILGIIWLITHINIV